MTAAVVMQRVAFGLTVAFAGIGSLFVIGSTFDDPGGWVAVGLVALWAVPMLALTFVAHRWPLPATWLLGFAAAIVIGALILDATPLVRVGPAAGIATFALGLPTATLGLRRPGVAGVLLVATAVLVLVAFVIGQVFASGGVRFGPSMASATSATIAVVPYLVIGTLFLLAAVLSRDAPSRAGESPSRGDRLSTG